MVGMAAQRIRHGALENMALNCAHLLMRIRFVMPSVQTTSTQRTRHSAKRATNLTLSADVLEAAKHLEINISKVCDSHLREVVRREQERRWRQEHADFILAYNATIETEGLPLDEWKNF
jgi:antitoxin CcdA